MLSIFTGIELIRAAY